MLGEEFKRTTKFIAYSEANDPEQITLSFQKTKQNKQKTPTK